MASLPVLMIGTGEYATGYGAGSAKTDKAMGVVALTLLDLRKRGFCGELHLAGVNGKKLPAIREYMRSAIGGAFPGSDFDFTMSTYPADDAVDPLAYRAALAVLPRGSAAIIFTPDDTHFSIAMDCVAAGVHTLVTKPVVMTLAQHKELAAAASAAGVIVAVEVHKRCVRACALPGLVAAWLHTCAHSLPFHARPPPRPDGTPFMQMRVSAHGAWEISPS